MLDVLRHLLQKLFLFDMQPCALVDLIRFLFSFLFFHFEHSHKSILEYLSSSGFSSSATEFQKEAAIEPDASSSNSGALEKKWTSVLRLQKKTMELEARVIQLTAELAEFTTGKASGKAPKQMIDMLPVAPARFELSGHRAPVTSVAFHPSVSLFVSTSEDAQIKIWDADSGELEKTLKGHTNAVNCAAFDKTGKILGTSPAAVSDACPLFPVSISHLYSLFCT